MAVASASDDKNLVVTLDRGIKGDPGTDGADGQGFASVRETKLVNPIVRVLAPNFPAVVGFDNLTWNRGTKACDYNKYGQFACALPGVPRETINGWMIEGAGTNLILSSDAPATQIIAVANQPHTLSFFGTGNIDITGAFTGSLTGTGATDRVSLTFTPATGDVTLTLTGTVEYAQLEQRDFMSSYITSIDGEGPGVRDADDVTMPGFNNTPNLDNDFSVFFRVYFDNFSGNDDFVISLPNGVNTDTKTVCCYVNNGTLTFRASDGTTNVDTTTAISLNTEYVVCLRKSSGTIYLHVGGALVDSAAHALTIPTGIAEVLRIGGNTAGTTKNMYGKIYDMRIYDFLLNDDEVTFLSEA